MSGRTSGLQVRRYSVILYFVVGVLAIGRNWPSSCCMFQNEEERKIAEIAVKVTQRHQALPQALLPSTTFSHLRNSRVEVIRFFFSPPYPIRLRFTDSHLAIGPFVSHAFFEARRFGSLGA